MPFRAELGQRFSGQDNVVYSLVRCTEPELRVPIGMVLKINHATPQIDNVRHPDEHEAAQRGIQYKKNKYELLRLFLGDFVPKSFFVLGKIYEGRAERYAEYTIQEEVPRVALGSLMPEQRNDPRLIARVRELMSRLQYMHDVLGEANNRSGGGSRLDGKLDLKGISDRIRTESLDYDFTNDDTQHIIDNNTSPNLLVDPDTLQIYCIDFGQGQWTEDMTETKAIAEQIFVADQAAAAGKLALKRF
jgi:hypothetical protein